MRRGLLSRTGRALVQQLVYVHRAGAAPVHFASRTEGAGHQSELGVDGLDVAHPRTLGPYAVIHTSPNVTGRGEVQIEPLAWWSWSTAAAGAFTCVHLLQLISWPVPA
jgi:hypothetical protein